MKKNEEMMMKIDDIKVGKRLRRDLGDIDDLAKSIHDVGLLQSVVVDDKGDLISGVRRIEACKREGQEWVPVRVLSVIDRTLAEIHENVKRLSFSPSEMVDAVEYLWPILEAEAKRRQKAGQEKGGKTAGRGRPKEGDSSVETFHKAIEKKTRDLAGAVVGVSGRTVQKARVVVGAARRMLKRTKRGKQTK